MLPGNPTGPLPPDAENAMAEMLKTSMPGLKTQAQYNAFMASFDALRVHLNAIFEGDKVRAEETKKTLEMAFTVAAQVTEASAKLREVPEAATGPGASLFKDAPVKFTEYDTQKRLLLELESIQTLGSLTEWYQTNRQVIDRVVSPDLRNHLLDTIRAKRNALTSEET